MERVTCRELLAATGGTAAGPITSDAFTSQVNIDSRTVAPGDLFWAVRGETHDGHDFVADALGRGAAAAVVADTVQDHAGPRVVVRDTHHALSQFARWYRQRRRALVIGVTGSVGKTTTREMIYAVLSSRLAGTRSPRNFNNQFGLPLSLLNIEDRHEYAVLELGASRVGEIRELASLAIPDVGVVTAVGPAHLAGFGSLEKVAQGKGELIESLGRSGLAVLAGDDPRVRAMRRCAACRTVTVGEEIDNDIRATDVQVRRHAVEFTVGRDHYRVPGAGRHLVQAALCGIVVAREWGITPQEIQQGLDSFQPVRGRCHVGRIGNWTVIDDTYNASPTSMQAACALLQEWDGPGQKILVTGDMLELGDEAGEWHRDLGRTAAATGVNHLICLGNHATDVAQGAIEGGMRRDQVVSCDRLGALAEALSERLSVGDVVLVKGSRGMRMERVVDWLRRRAEEHSMQETRLLGGAGFPEEESRPATARG